MYRYTFSSRVTMVAAFVLCISLLLQPVANAYAQDDFEENQTEPTVVTTTVSPEPQEIVESIENEISTDTTEPITAVADEENQNEITESEEDVDIDPDVSGEIDATLVAEPTNILNATNTAALPTGTSSDQGVQADVSTSTATTTKETSDESDSEVDNLNESNPQSSDSETSSENESPNLTQDDEVEGVPTEAESSDSSSVGNSDISTSTQPDIIEEDEQTVQEVSVVHSDQAIAFNRNECTEVADGSFYCQKLNLEDLPEDALFAAPDSSGDMEIYVVRDGVERKLTDNVMEDASPYFDSRSNTIVWHRLINDRYQIVSYDVDSGEETQLTDTRVNNMEPTRSGQYTVWQRWVSNNWEIILYDGTTEIQLTDSLKHDIAPHIHGDMIIWNVRSNDGTQSLMTYEIGTQTFNVIADTEGVSVINPRMLVMYEAQYENGDSVMKGFDLVTGEIVPLEHLPRELPTNLPEPDATGETRALPTHNNDEELQEQIDPEDDQPQLPNPPPGATTTVSTTTIEVSPDLDLRPTEPSIATTTDLIVEQAAIPDVVVPAFEATTSNLTASSTQEI